MMKDRVPEITMKPLASAVLTVALALAAATAVRAQTASSADAGRSLETFLLAPDDSGRSFVAADADRAELGAAARAWAAKEPPGRLSPLLLCVSNPAGESRLRAALASWAGSGQIKKEAGVRAAAAFLSDAADKAGQVMADPRARREIEASISANDSAAPAVPGAREAVERARLLRERRGSGNAAVFGPDRQVQDTNAGGFRSSSIVGGGAVAGGGTAGGTATAGGTTGTRGVPAKIAPAVQLPKAQGRPDGIKVPAPGAGDSASAATAAGGGTAGNPGQAGAVPDDGRVKPEKPMGVVDRVKDSFKHPMSDAYGFTFEGLEPQPVSFRDHVPALAYARKAKAGAFSHVILYGHGAPGYMTVGQWGGDAGDISSLLKGKMRAGSLLEIKGCNTSSVGGMSVNPGRGLSSLTRRVLYFSIPYLSEGRDENMRKQLEEDWNADLARDTSRQLPGVKVCGFRTFGLVGDRIPLVGSLLGRREATNSNAILGSKACYVDAKEVDP